VRAERFDEVLRYVGSNVRRWRTRRGLTQAGLAEAADLDLRFVQRIERAAGVPSLRTLLAIADALEVGPAALFRAAKLQPGRTGRPATKRRTR
jgi:transcriptional regulator with XRE-family HTH domain